MGEYTLLKRVSFKIYADNYPGDIITSDELISVSNAPEIDRFPLPSTSCTGLTFDGEFLWTGDYNNLYKINMTDGSTVTSDSNSSRRYHSLSWGDGALWATSSDYTKIIKINSTTFEEILVIDHPWSTANGLAWSVDGIFVYDDSIQKIYLLNDTTGLVIDDFDYYDVVGVVIKDGFLWASRYWDNQVIKTTQDTGGLISYINLDPSTIHIEGLTFTNNSLWIIDNVSDSIIGYDVSGTADLVIYPDQDTYVDYRSEEDINGLSTSVYVNDRYHAYLRFPLSQFNNLSSAYIEIYQQYSQILDIDIYGIESDVWDQLTMNWNNRLLSSTGIIGSIEIFGENWYSLNVTDFIISQTDGWATFLIKTQSDTSTLSFRSIESTSSEVPMLSINGTVYESEMIPGPLTETYQYTETETETHTTTKFATTVTETENVTEFYTTETETIWGTTIINTENITEYLTNTDDINMIFILPACIY